MRCLRLGYAQWRATTVFSGGAHVVCWMRAVGAIHGSHVIAARCMQKLFIVSAIQGAGHEWTGCLSSMSATIERESFPLHTNHNSDGQARDIDSRQMVVAPDRKL